MKHFRLFLCVAIAGCLMSCNDINWDFFGKSSTISQQQLVDASFVVDPAMIRAEIDTLLKTDRDTLASDAFIRQHYRQNGELLWLQFLGARTEAVETMWNAIRNADKEGLNPNAFAAREIEREMGYLAGDSAFVDDENVNKHLARLEYYLSKGCFRYAKGQRYGFLNPQPILNHLDRNEQDSTRRTFRRLTDLPLEQPTTAFYQQVKEQLAGNRVEELLQDVKPLGQFYELLCKRLAHDTIGTSSYRKTIANLERCRWRLTDDPRKQQRYVLVNIPAFYLYAIDGSHVTSMKIGCGTYATKTPMLTSKIKLIELNPLWVIPHSILKSEVSRHLGDSAWFARHRYFIREKATGQLKDPRALNRYELLSGKYTVAQENGAGNSLGRIIFRFDNPFSVYIHHTSSPGFFTRDHRGVSHGCIRVEKPIELAEYMIGSQHKELLDRIRYSTSVDISSMGVMARNRGVKPSASIDRKRLISSVPINPQVPLYVAYYTLYPNNFDFSKATALTEHPDVYGYDRVIAERLRVLGFVQ